MKNKGNQVNIKINVEQKPKKFSISKLFFKMNPLRDPKMRLKIAEDMFLNKCIQNNLSQREYESFSERKKLQKYNLKKIKYAYDFSFGELSNNSIQKNINNININNILNNKSDILITSLNKKNKYLSSSIHKKHFYKKNNLIEKGIQTKSYLNNLKSNLNKNNTHKIKKNLTLNCQEIHFIFSNGRCIFCAQKSEKGAISGKAFGRDFRGGFRIWGSKKDSYERRNEGEK